MLVLYLQVYNSLIKYNKHLDIYLSDIDISWLRNYELWLREEGVRFRTLRAVYNVIEDQVVKAEIIIRLKITIQNINTQSLLLIYLFDWWNRLC